MKSIVILFSGEGSNLENIIRSVDPKLVKVSKAITNNPAAPGINRARALGVEVEIIDHTLFPSRESFDAELVKSVRKSNADLVVLAGFMRILTPVFTDAIRNAVNIHPSLLPMFKGADAARRSFESSMKVAGVTVHWVSAELDSGEIIDQRCFYKGNLDFDGFMKRIKEIEHEMYPRVIMDLLTKREI